MNYLLCWSHDDVWLVGPFSVYEDSVEFGRKQQAELGDDPRWNTIELADPFGLRIVTPSQSFV